MLTAEWTSIVKQIRNYPCVFDYTMNNEDVAMQKPLAPDLYKLAKQLDPKRLVNTADGVFGGNMGPLPNPTDFRSAGFALQTIPILDPHQFQIKGHPPVPLINHEMGNFVSWPMLEDEISRFAHNIKPYWLTPAYNKIASKNSSIALSENVLWSAASNRLFLFCWKDKMEALRKTEKISGNEWWLLQDYWMGSNGILDAYYAPKHPESEMREIANMNAGVMLLIAEAPGDNLPLPAAMASKLLRRAYSSKDVLESSLHVSNYGAADIPASATLTWEVIGMDAAGLNTTICSKSKLPLPASGVPQGPNTTMVGAISCALPDLGDFQHAPKGPLTLTVRAELLDGAGKSVAHNAWRARVYAAALDGPAPPGITVYTTPKLCQHVPIGDMKCALPTVNERTGKFGPYGKMPKGTVVVIDELNQEMLALASEGCTVLVLNNGSHDTTDGGQGGSGHSFGIKTDKAVFKTAWWLGSASDNNMGTVAYKHPVFAGMTPDGWADEGWVRLIQGGVNYILEVMLLLMLLLAPLRLLVLTSLV